MKRIYLFFLVVLLFSACGNDITKVKTNYFDLSSESKEKFSNELKIENGKLSEGTVDVVKDYAKKYLLASSNPVSNGLVSNYFWYVYNALPEFVNKDERHKGYYVDQNKQPLSERLIAYAIYRIDRSPENLNLIFKIVEPELLNFLSVEKYDELMIRDQVDGLIGSYEQITQIQDYKKLLSEAYSETDTATGRFVDYGEGEFFEEFNMAYGLDVYTLSEIVCGKLGISGYEPFYGSPNVTFWMRRNNEDNMKAVYDILKQIEEIYKN